MGHSEDSVVRAACRAVVHASSPNVDFEFQNLKVTKLCAEHAALGHRGDLV